MATQRQIVSFTPKSANIILTDDYLILKGGHYEIFNGYTKYIKEPHTIVRKDILTVSSLTMRSKRLFQTFITICFIFFTSGTLFRTISSAMKLTNSQWSIIETLFKVLIENEYASGILTFVAIILVLSFVTAVSSLVLWFFIPHRFMVISAIGKTIAVEEKHYNKNELQELEHFLNTFSK